MKSILKTILGSTRARVEASKATTDYEALKKFALDRRAAVQPFAFSSALCGSDGLNVIAEFKKASPSKGLINELADPAATARSYEAAGACAISVLTEPEFFKGSLDDLRAVRTAVSIPVLRKDFVVDEFQIFEAAEAGADAILLIVSALSTADMIHFSSVARDILGMDVLVEVHNQEEMKIANDIGARLIGVNNRDLGTFDVSLNVSRELVQFAADNSVLVSESGLKSRDELVELRGLGYSAFLIGETLMRNSGVMLDAELLR
jgi:indole-3-glycerol phosphate synthase